MDIVGKIHRQKEKLNIKSNAEEPIAKILSNLASTPFVYGGIKFISIESALQGIKFKDLTKQKEIFAMSGLTALKVGRKITNSMQNIKKHFIYWRGEKFSYNGSEHKALIKIFIRKKIRQNKNVQEALLSTKDFFIHHDVDEESSNASLPKKLYIQILISERDRLEKKLLLCK